MTDKKYVSYEDFGAVGDGKADDMAAIVKAHEYANEKRLPVKAREGARYYIGKEPLTAIITTDTDLSGAELYILPVYDRAFTPDRPFPYVPTKRLSARNITTVCKRVAKPYRSADLYPDTVCGVK